MIAERTECDHAELCPSYLDNIHRLGLAEIKDDNMLSAEGTYKPLVDDFRVKELRAQLEGEKKATKIREGCIDLTDFGRQFCAACLPDIPTAQ